MPTEVLRSDTFELWRQKTNTISSDLGTRGDLSVNITANGSLVTAINELQSDIGVVGSLATAATNLVGAVNELKNSAITFNGIKTFADNLNLASTKVFTIDGTSVLSSTTLGSGVVNSSLTTVGTIATGVWQGTIVAPTYGGTGVNNGSRTITLLTGNLSLTAQAGGSSVTVPSTGTLATLAGAETLTTKTINLANNTLTGTLAQFNIALSDDDFAGLATAQTLTNKSIALGSNTVTGTLAQFNTALTDDDFAALAAAQTLTNKSLQDANTFIIDDVAATKRARFEASGITAGQTRVLTIQDKDGTIATTTDTTFIGTTSISLSRGSGNLALTGISSVAFPGSTSGTVTLQAAATAGTTTLTMPATTGTVITSGDTGTVTNAMLAGSIANNKLSNSSVTYNGVNVALGGSGTITSNTTNALTIGDGLSGTSFNGSAAVTIAADSTIARRADTHFIGTTSVALNRASANLGLTGISSVTLPGATSGTIVLTPAAIAGTTTITLPATTGTLITTGDSGTVSNTMLANSSLTVSPGTGMSGGGLVALGGTVTLNNSDRGSSQNIFKNIAVIGQTTIATTVNSDTLNVAIGTVDALAGLTITTNAATKTLTIGHADTSSQATSTNTGGTVIQSITLDTYGHVTGLATVNAGGLYQPLDGDLTAIGAIADGSTGYLKKDGANTWSLDTTVVTTAGSQALTNKTYSGSALTVTTGQAQGSPITVSRVTNTTYASNVQDRFYIDSNGNVTIRGDLSVAGNTSISSSSLSPLWANVTNKPTPTYTVELTGGPVTGSGTSTASEVGSSVTVSLTNVAITDGAVTTAKIGDAQVTNAKIANTTIANTKLVNSSVTISAGTGLTDGGAVSLGGTVTLTNSDRGSSQNIFKNIAVGGQATVQADNNDDTLTLATDGSLVITTNATTDTITIVHADTSSVAALSSDNSNGVVLQDISFTYDTYGHVLTSSVATTDLDSRYVRLSNAAQQTIGPGDLLFTGNLSVTGNLTVNGTTTTVNSTTATVKDPIITLGGADAGGAAATDDNKDRGIEFRWNNGVAAKTGFFGYDDSTGYFTFIPDATNTSEVFSGAQGDIQAANFRGALVGNATTASTWQTSRTLTIGSTSKPVNGSADVSWTLAEIGAIGPNGNTSGQAGSVQNALTIGAGLSGTVSTYNGSAAVTISHTDTSSAADLVASSRRYVTGLSFDTYGHVIGYTTATETVVDTDTNTTYSIKATTPGTGGGAFLDLDAGGSGSGTDSVRFVGSGSTTVTRTDADTITITSTDTNTTYTAGTGLTLTGTVFSVTGGTYQPAGTYVTSVGATAPIASSGGTTPTISLNSAYGDTLNPYGSKAPNLVLATPNGASGVPSFRALVPADIPALNYQAAGTYLTSLTSDGLILGISGTTTAKNVYVLPQATNTVLAGPTSGVSSVTPTFRALVPADIPTLNQSTTGSAGSVQNALTVGTGLAFDSGTTYNGSAAKTISLPASGVTANTYNNVTVNDRGIVTGGSNAAYLTSASAVTSLAGTASQILVNGVTSAQTGAVTLSLPQNLIKNGRLTLNQNMPSGASATDTLRLTGTQQGFAGFNYALNISTTHQTDGFSALNAQGISITPTIDRGTVNNHSYYGIAIGNASSTGTGTVTGAYGLYVDTLAALGSSTTYSIWAEQDVYVKGILKTGTSTISLTDSAGRINSSALNTVAVGQGGTGTTTLTGYVKGNGASAFTASSTIPSTDISNSTFVELSGTQTITGIKTHKADSKFDIDITGGGGYVKFISGANSDALAGSIFRANSRLNIQSYHAATGGVMANGLALHTGNGTNYALSLNNSGDCSIAQHLTVGSGALSVGTSALGAVGEIRATDNITAYYTSDERLKTNVRPIENALDKVSQLDGVIYDWNDTYKKDHGDVDGYFVRADNSGVIAQQVEKVFPNVVADRANGFKAVRYELLVPLLIEAIKDLKAEIEALKAQK